MCKDCITDLDRGFMTASFMKQIATFIWHGACREAAFVRGQSTILVLCSDRVKRKLWTLKSRPLPGSSLEWPGRIQCGWDKRMFMSQLTNF